MLIFFKRFRSSGRPFGIAQGKGFTLIELMVVMSIMVVVTSVLLFRQSRFDSSTLLRSLAYSVALSVRQAQVYGTSVLGTTTASGITYASAYGIHLVQPAGSPPPPVTTYILFADLNSNGRYDLGEDVKVFNLNAGYSISKVLVNQISPAIALYFPSGGLSTLDIVFRRPNPDACFSSDATANPNGPTACQASSPAVFSSASIQIQNQGDTANTRNVCVYQTGQIAVEPPVTNCP